MLLQYQFGSAWRRHEAECSHSWQHTSSQLHCPVTLEQQDSCRDGLRREEESEHSEEKVFEIMSESPEGSNL